MALLLLFAAPCLTALASRLEPPRPRRDALPLPELARVPLLRRVRSPRLPTYAEAQASAVQHLPGFLSEDDLAAIHRLAARVRQRQGTAGNWSHTVERLHREGGRTVFVNHHLADELPGLYARMLRAAHDADRHLWGGTTARTRARRFSEPSRNLRRRSCSQAGSCWRGGTGSRCGRQSTTSSSATAAGRWMRTRTTATQPRLDCASAAANRRPLTRRRRVENRLSGHL